ncbi:MAG: large-conductance mechanosensitive channel protein MscL [Planctomycetaceae bacterium]|nr:large-conductance mechanosensitive channel protein MscL [Planctomycetaceae bacterium]
MGMIKEFKEFAMKGNVMDMAVGIIIGAGFGKIVSSFVNDVVMPPIGMLMGNVDFSELAWTLASEGADGKPVVIKYGLFINSVLDFVIVAFVIFMLIKQMNRLKSQEPEPAPTEKKCPKCLMVVPFEASRCGHCTSEI